MALAQAIMGGSCCGAGAGDDGWRWRVVMALAMMGGCGDGDCDDGWLLQCRWCVVMALAIGMTVVVVVVVAVCGLC